MKANQRIKRHKRIRGKIFGTSEVPRFCVFRSNKHIYAQLIDDDKAKTIVSADDKKIKASGKISIAEQVGKLIAQKAIDKKIKKVVFDRGGYKYHGRIKSLADSARKAGLKF